MTTSNFEARIKTHDLEFYDDEHVYLVDGVIVPSITQILSVRFGRKYEAVNADVLERAREKGVRTHNEIERFCKTGEAEDLPEIRNFKFLKKAYGFEVIENEVPVILFDDKGHPEAAGRLDMVIEMDGKKGIADIKRTATLDKEYLAFQLNLYRIAYIQSYGGGIDLLRGIHLREDKRKFVTIPVSEELAKEILEEWKGRNK